MKKQVVVLGLLFFSAVGFSQSNVFPPSGNVGIGNTSPLVKLDVRTTGIGYPLQSEKLAFFGTYSTNSTPNTLAGLYVVNKVKLGIVPNPTTRSTVLQYSSGELASTTFNKGFIELNAPATTNTPASAISFGNNAVEFMRINQDGKVRIGDGANDIKTPNGYKLFVEEGILTEKVKVAVKTTTNWADHVFNNDYSLMPLNEVETFVKENKHLPNVPSAAKMVENGLDVAQMDAKLLEKVEELTLYIIDQNKNYEEQNKQIEEQNNQIKELKAAVQILMEKK